MNLYVVGCGKVGAALCKLWHQAGLNILGAWTRSKETAERAAVHMPKAIAINHGYPFPKQVAQADVVVVALSDKAVADGVGRLASEGLLKPHHYLLHTCGSLSPSCLVHSLAPVRGVGVIHPLQSCADSQSAIRLLPQSHFILQAEGATLEIAKELATCIGAKWAVSHGQHPALYHAGACMASSHCVALLARAAHLVSQATGVSGQEAISALSSLLRGALSNLETHGIPQGLTGPQVRKDHLTVASHQKALEDLPIDLQTYQILSSTLEELLSQSGNPLQPGQTK